MDRIDQAILRVLQEDGRATNAEVAARVNLSESACSRRMRQLEAEGVVAGYAAIVDPRKVDLGLSVFLTITLVSQAEATLAAFEAAVCAVPEVMECYLMTGEADYLMRVVVRDMDAFGRLHSEKLTRLPGVVRVVSSLALRAAVRRKALPI